MRRSRLILLKASLGFFIFLLVGVMSFYVYLGVQLESAVKDGTTNFVKVLTTSSNAREIELIKDTLLQELDSDLLFEFEDAYVDDTLNIKIYRKPVTGTEQ